MNPTRCISLSMLGLVVLLGGCATRPIDPPITQANLETGYTFQTRQKHFKSQENLVVLAFSGGGTRAAAFSYGVLEFLRRTEVTGPKGNKVRLLDAVSTSVQVDVNGAVKGTIKGDDFAKAFLSIWLGADPPNPEIKAGMLGAACG